jgi:hypothetical protein
MISGILSYKPFYSIEVLVTECALNQGTLIIAPEPKFSPDEIKITVMGAIRHISDLLHPNLIPLSCSFLRKINHTIQNMVDMTPFI